MMIVDAHLDLAFNAFRGVDVLLPANKQLGRDDLIPSVGLPDLVAGGVGLICPTIFCLPDVPGHPGYKTACEAHAVAAAQLDWYLARERENRLHFIRRSADLQAVTGDAIKAILLLEGADPIRTSQDLDLWFEAGLRIVGLAWRRTRYAGGTGEPGPLTAAGVDLLPHLDRLGIIHDVSHLAEESFWQLLDMSTGPVIASHSNCRAIVPTDRQLSDDMIRALAARGAVIGINFFDKFLVPPDQFGQRRANLDDVVAHIRHIADITGSARHIGLGTDMDGGLGRDQIPDEIKTSADLHRVGDALSRNGFLTADIQAILGGNWESFFSKNLPD